jgi:Flp pilus assembly protein TadD
VSRTTNTTTEIARELRDLAARGNRAGAVKAARQALSSDPNNGTLVEQIGLALFEMGESELARTALESAQLLTPLSAGSELALAECFARTDKAELAIALLGNAGIRPESSCRIRLRCAALLDKLGHHRSAWCIGRRAVNEHPDEAQAWFDLSFYMGRLGFPLHQIEATARRAIFLAPDNVSYRLSLASVLARRGRAEDAHQLVSRFGPEELEQVCCADCLENLKEVFEAASDWRGAVLVSEHLVLRSLDQSVHSHEEL